MKLQFTDRAMAKLSPPGEGRKDYLRFAAQASHLAVRVSADSRHFVFQGRLADGSTFRKTLGKFPGLTVAGALKATKVLDGELAKGVDLRAERAGRKAKRDRARADAGFTFRDLILEWEEVHKPKCRPSYVKGTADGLRRAYVRLLNRPAAAVTLGQLEEVWESLADLPAAANAAAERVRTVCSWGVKTKKLSADPTQGVDLPEKPEKRTHAPTGAEARKIWAAASTMSARDRAAISLLQVSLLRRTEAFGALWSEFSDDYSKFSPSPQRMKMGKPFVVWLPPVMQKMLAELPKFGDSDLLFSRDGRKPLTGYSGLKTRLDVALKDSGVRPFRLHDLRRSGVIWLAEAGVSSIVADRLLGHASLKSISPTADIYNVYEFAAERQAALALWADFLTGEEEASSSPSSQLMLPVPEVEILPADKPTATVVREVRYIPLVKPSEVEEKFHNKFLELGLHPDVRDANDQILKSKLTPAFEREFPHNPHVAAIKAVAYAAVQLAINEEAMCKRADLKAERAKWEEEAEWRRADIRSARGLAQRMRAEGNQDSADLAETDAARLEDEVVACGQMLRGLILPDNPRCATYLPGGASSKASLAQGVMQGLKLRNIEIFGREHAGWAAAYANAATGGGVTRFQRRQRRPRAQGVPPKGAAR